MTKKEPLISIIMPLYNCQDFVQETVASVSQQKCQNWELIIVDDSSSDDSYEIVQRAAIDDARIKLYQLEYNSGVVAARNHAIKMASGDYIAFLDSDDLWSPR